LRVSLRLMFACLMVEGSRPRGVRPELGSFYNPASDFSCMDGSGSIPFIQVNDDYCDCDDGSDEPGTAACPGGKFYCENKSHDPLTIPSSRVNDGICDCCDGSDEWETGKCKDMCTELGRAAREAALAQAKVALEGFNIKQGMINEGKILQEERASQLAEKENRKLSLEAEKEELRLAKEAAEAPEKEALEFYRQLEEEENKKREEEEKEAKAAEAEVYFKELDTDADGFITVQELQARPGLDTNKDGDVSEEEAQFFLSGSDQFDLDSFKSTGFLLLKPYLDLEQVEPEVEPEVVQEPELDENLQQEETDSAQVEADPVVYDPWRQNQQKEEVAETEEGEEDYDEEKEDEDKEDADDDYDISDSPPTPESVNDDKIEDKYDDKTRALIDAADVARKSFEAAERQLRDIDNDIKNIKTDMEKDYGSDNVFSVLSGQCFEYKDNEYTYKMCPFDSCSQRSNSGGAETRLGSWSDWQGPQENRYSQMKFSGGQQCWNGPSRSATIHVHCGTTNSLNTVSEPNRCEYEMHFNTPAACSKPDLNHDEL